MTRNQRLMRLLEREAEVEAMARAWRDDAKALAMCECGHKGVDHCFYSEPCDYKRFCSCRGFVRDTGERDAAEIRRDNPGPIKYRPDPDHIQERDAQEEMEGVQ